MDTSAAVTVTVLTGPALNSQVDVLALTSFGDPTKDAVFKSADAALGGHLAEAAKHESFEGKTARCLLDNATRVWVSPVNEEARAVLLSTLDVDAETRRFIDEAQSTHDQIASPDPFDSPPEWTHTPEEEFVKRLDGLAAHRGLKVAA